MAEAAGIGVTLDSGDIGSSSARIRRATLSPPTFDQAEALMVAAGQAGVAIAWSAVSAATSVQLGRDSAPLAELVRAVPGQFRESHPPA